MLIGGGLLCFFLFIGIYGVTILPESTKPNPSGGRPASTAATNSPTPTGNAAAAGTANTNESTAVLSKVISGMIDGTNVALADLPVTKADAAEANRIAGEMMKNINSLVDFTVTMCVPSTGRTPGSFSMVIFTKDPLLHIESSKKAWLLTVVAVAGQACGQHPEFRMDQVILADSTYIKQHKGLFAEAARCQFLQTEVKGGRMTMEKLYEEILGALVEKKIEK